MLEALVLIIGLTLILSAYFGIYKMSKLFQESVMRRLARLKDRPNA